MIGMRPVRDPVREQLLADLRLFRRLPGKPDLGRVELTAVLTDLLGRGSLSHALGALTYLVELHTGTDPDSRLDSSASRDDIAMYWATAGGYQIGGDTLDRRLRQIAEQHYVDARTILRASDRGADKIAGLIRDNLTNERPWATLVIIEEEATSTLHSHLAITMPEGTTTKDPHVYMNGVRALDLDFDNWTPDETLSGWLRVANPLPQLHLEPQSEEPDYLALIQIYWYPTVYPSWTLSCQLAAHHLAKLDVDQGGRVEAKVTTDPARLMRATRKVVRPEPS